MARSAKGTGMSKSTAAANEASRLSRELTRTRRARVDALARGDAKEAQQLAERIQILETRLAAAERAEGR